MGDPCLDRVDTVDMPRFRASLSTASVSCSALCSPIIPASLSSPESTISSRMIWMTSLSGNSLESLHSSVFESRYTKFELFPLANVCHYPEIQRKVKNRKLNRLGKLPICDVTDESVLPECIRLWTIERYIGAWIWVCGCHRIPILHVLVVVFTIGGDLHRVFRFSESCFTLFFSTPSTRINTDL